MKTLYTTYNNFAKRLVMSLMVLMTVGVGSVLGAEYEEMLTLDVAKNAPTGTNSTALTINEIKSYLQNAAPNTSNIKSAANKTGDVYKGKGSGGDGIPQKCLKIGKASGSGGFTFTIADSFDDIAKVDIIGYGWKTTSSISVNGAVAQKPSTAASQTTFSFELAEATKTITISVTTSAVCVTSIKLYKAAPSGHAVTYNNGGRGTAPVDETATSVTLSEITATGYTNTGWKADVAVKNGSTTISAGTLIENGTTVTLTQATTFTAQWQANKYTITLDNQSADIAGTTSITATYNSNANLITNITIPQKNYHDFGGYYTQTNGNGTQLIDSEGKFKAGVSGYTDAEKIWKYANDITLYAKWTERPLTNYRTSCGSAATLVSIAVSGQTTTYNVGDSFSFDGTCIATYDDESTKTVTPTSVSSPDMSTAGTKTVTVTYTEGDVTVTTTYEIVVNVVKTATSLTWSADSYTATIASPSNLFPTLKVDPEAIKGSVTYSSSHPEYATIDANGNIILKSAGETTITASYAGDEDYAAAEDTYTLIVEESDNCRWEEVTINDIEYGDEVVIAMKTDAAIYAMSINDAATATPEATIITPSNFATDNGIGVDLTWYIEKDVNRKLIIRPKKDITKNVYCNTSADNDRVRVGNYHNNHELYKTFEIDGNYLKNSGVYYIGVNITKNQWWGYINNDNLPGQTLKLYKKVCLPEGQYRVTWDANGGQWSDGSTTKEEVYAEGATINKPEKPKRDGYEFTEWAPNPTTMPDENTTFTAQWAELHTITWMVGSSSVLTEDVANGTGVTQTPASNPEGDAIGDCADTFLGWSEKSAGSTPQDADYYDDLCSAADMKSKHTSVTGDKTFFAVFASVSGSGAPTAYTAGDVGNFVLAAKNGSKWYALPANPTVNSGKIQGVEITVTTTSGVEHVTTANASGYTWTIANATNGQTISDGSKYIYHSNGGASGTNLTYGNSTSSTWKIAKESAGLTFKAMNGTTINNRGMLMNETKFGGYSLTNEGENDYYRISVFPISDGVSYSNYVTNCCATPVPTNGSYTSPSGTSVTLTWDGESTRYHITGNGLDDYTDDESYTVTDLTECNEYTFYVSAYPEGGCESEAIAITAQPFSGSKTVTFNYNGNGQANTTSSTSCGNTSITLPTPTWAGYRFMGWFNAASGGTKIGEAGASYKPTDDITLHAHWAKEYSVTYNANGGSTTCANDNYIEGETVTLCTSTPSKTGYTFAGWTYSPEVTITDGKFIMPASDVTITAQWTINQYKVTWNPNGGNWGGSTANIVETYEYGATIVQPAAPQRDGYRFTGWSPAVSSTMPAGNKTYTAQWKQNYTITFHDGDDVTPWTQTKDAESINLTEYVGTLACDDYQFAGWSTADTKYNDETANITTWVTGNYTPTANIDLYAVYSKGAVTNDFTLNCAGGVYEIWEKGHNQHMAGRLNGGGYGFQTTEYWDQYNTESNGAPFTITKVADNTYTLQNADGQYITRDSYDGNADELEIEERWENADRYKWTISNGTNGTWRFANKAATSYALVYYNNRYFELRSASSVTAGNTTTYDLELTPAQTNVYQSNPNCGPYYIIFNTHGGEFIQGEYAYGEEQTGLTETTYSKFPAAELDGYTFAGWKDGTPQDDINYEPYLKKAGDNLVVSSNKTYHAVYYYYDEEEEIDWSEEFTTGMYADVNGTKYFLSGTPNRGTMSSTTDCGYVSEVTITPGTGANAGKYKITVNGVAMAPKENETDLLNGTYWWTITERSVGAGEYKISGQDKKNIVLRNSSWGHYTYNQGSEYGEGYYYPRFGKCLQHHWTSNPTLKPSLNLSGNIYITATNSRAIRSTETLSVVANNLSSGESITLTSNSSDIYFSTDKNFNFALGQADNQKPTTSLTFTANADGLLEQTIYVHYKPVVEGDGVPTDVVVTATASSVAKNQTIHVRNLPAKFVIATKVGATWYALPADMMDDTNPLAEVIEVDETTMTATAPNTSTYTLWPVKTTNGTENRYADYGDRVRFAAVNNEQRGLWANNNNNSSAIRNYAVINSLGADGLAAYEWKLTTTVVDGHWQYTLQTDQTQNQNYLRYWTSAEGTPVGPKWGTYNAGENKLYFLPVTETEPFEYKVVEWYPTKMLIQTEEAISLPTVKVGGEDVTNPILTDKGGKLYEISNLPLETNPNALLQVSFTNNAINYTNTKVVPVILSRGEKTITGEPFATLTQKVYQYADVVVRDGATLSIDGDTDGANTLLGMTIYPTAKVAVAEGYKLSVHSLTFFGGIDEIYNGSSYEINKYGVPQLSLKGKLNKTVTNMDYIMRVDLKQMYQVGVPYDVNLEEITYWDGTKIELGEELYVSAYDGQKRANLESAWVCEVNFAKPPILKAGIGYTISADMQSGVGNEYSIIRLPMKSNVTSGNTEVAKIVQVYAYANTNGVEITDNNKGWNYLSNPYMAAISGAEADSKLVVGYLDRNEVTEPWEWVNDTYRYVTIPSDDGTYHYQQKFKDAILNPFKSFFLQIAAEGELSFDLVSRQSAPARYLQTDNEKREVEFEVLLANDTRSDNLGFLIGEDYTPAYEINADLEKMIGSMSIYTIYNGYNLAYNALSPTNAAEQIPIGYVVPTVGEYTFALDESSDIEDVEHIYLIDYETSAITDLVTDVYTFTASEQKSDTRFAINVTLKSKESTVTGLVNINKDSEQSLKFIHNDKIYILHNGIIYDATGKFVETINK